MLGTVLIVAFKIVTLSSSELLDLALLVSLILSKSPFYQPFVNVIKASKLQMPLKFVVNE